MAEIEVGPLSDRLTDDEIAELSRQMDKHGVPHMPTAAADEESAVAEVAETIDDDALSEFFTRLEASDAAAEIYLPVEFDGTVETAGLRAGSLNVLIDVLGELKDELDLADEEDEDEDEDEDDLDEEQELLDGQLRQAWKLMNKSAQLAFDRKLPLHVKF